MAPEKLGLNSEETNTADEVDPFPADMVKNPALPSLCPSCLGKIPVNDLRVLSTCKNNFHS